MINRFFKFYFLGLALMGLPGCQSQNRPDHRTVRLEPIAPMPLSNQLSETQPAFSSLTGSCSEAALNQGPDSTVTELLLVYSNTGRDFQAPDGTDGYLLRVIPINRRYQLARIDGNLSVFLYEERSLVEDNEALLPIRIWQIPSVDLDHYWLKTSMLAGYTLPLAWDSPPPAGTGRYIFLVQFRYEIQQEHYLICNTLTFQDLLITRTSNP